MEQEIVIGIGTIAYCTKKQKFQPKREPGEIGNQTAPKNENPDMKPPSLCTEKRAWGKLVQNKQTRRYNFVQHSVLQNDAILATM